MNITHIVILLVFACLAGWVDSIVGGGGLVQLPAFLLAFPGIPPVVAIGTGKVPSLLGTASAAVKYLRNSPVRMALALPVALAAFLFGGVGAGFASLIPTHVFRPVIIAVLIGVAAFVALRPGFGTREGTSRAGDSASKVVLITAIAAAIGLYDGLIGSGTGTFLAVAMVWALRTDYVGCAPMVKVANIGSNAGALVVFAYQGHVLWILGLGMALCNVLGAQIGASMALRLGAGFVRRVLLVVVLAMATRLAFQ
ncbi:sulfite exporter TauE/SafE family protein [Streptomyces morookaense]|uniref:Probable membrane transporter protein n=1 Tax=Streptomyces morookaense TaxID=1970 RepID=A0A7Y7B0D6_STRMO|nr:TSUP family transporter [Streptomyces morookaense]NVK76733.1 TSUP family transporter [Streptomyces morookaense]GHF26829.1 UPF0721 transmembrane protein [Streptomyces morookaense]